MPTSIVWFRQDLRVADNPALHEACARGGVLPVYIDDDDAAGDWPPGGASRWWRAQSLKALDDALRARGSGLVVLDGPAEAALERTAAAVEADAVFWNRRYEPASIRHDRDVMAKLKERGLAVTSSNGRLLFEPWTVTTKNGDPYKVYTPFARACLNERAPRQPYPAPARIQSPKVPSTLVTKSIGAGDPPTNWEVELGCHWQPGVGHAENALDVFLEDKVADYGDSRDRPDLRGTSELSPRLHWGELSPHQVWQATVEVSGGADALDPGRGSNVFLKELLWREFGYHIFYHISTLPETPLKPAFARFPWADDKDNRNAWRFGRTGYPIVDAGMRQLRLTGWMHNRVRMVAGSFLVKDLLEDWRQGARWFWDNLVDADLASNTLGWQWVSGCGPDAAPYFRIFNPVKQGWKFDPDGAYVRRFVPELAGLPAEHIHAPWEAPADVLDAAGVTLGKTYPAPIVDHRRARQRALDALATIKQAA